MNKPTSPTSPDRDSEETVPLISYVFVLVGWWREIALCTFLMAIGCGTLMMAVRVLVPRYETSSAVALLRVTSNVAIDKKFSTGATGDARVSGRREGWNAASSRRAALVGLVKTGKVARVVAERLSEKLGEKDIPAARLLESIDAGLVTVGALSLRNSSNLIRITARADSPERVAFIANAWAEEYVNHVNNLYRYTPANQLDMIYAELKRTQEAYHAAQKELETFLAASKVASLNNEIVRRQHILTKLYELQNALVTNAVHTEEENIKRKSEAVTLYVEMQSKKLSENYAYRRRLEQLVSNATDLRSQIENGGERVTIANSLALLLLKADAYAPSTNLPKSLEISLDNSLGADVSKAEFLVDIEAFVVTLQQRIENIDAFVMKESREIRHGASLVDILDRNLIFSDSQNGNSGPVRIVKQNLSEIATQVLDLEQLHTDSRITQLVQNLERDAQLLRMEVERMEATQSNLIQNRDVQRAALQTLQNEIVELKLAMSAFTSEVRLASRALVPVDPAYPSVVLIAGLGGIAGLLAVVSLVFLLNSQGSSPLLEKWRATRPGQSRGAG